jgi:hypothetical protein
MRIPFGEAITVPIGSFRDPSTATIVSPTFASGDSKITNSDEDNVVNLGSSPTQIGTTGLWNQAITAAEASFARRQLKYVDQDGPVWLDKTRILETEDHPLAQYPGACVFEFTVDGTSISGTSIVAAAGVDGVASPAEAEELIISPGSHIAFIWQADTGVGQFMPLVSFDYTGGASELLWTLLKAFNRSVTGTTIRIKVYELGRVAAHIIEKISTLDLTATEKTSVGTNALQKAFAAAYGSLTAEQVLGKILSMIAGPTVGAGTVSEAFKKPDGSANDVVVENDGTDRTTTDLSP